MTKAPCEPCVEVMLGLGRNSMWVLWVLCHIGEEQSCRSKGSEMESVLACEGPTGIQEAWVLILAVRPSQCDLRMRSQDFLLSQSRR